MARPHHARDGPQRALDSPQVDVIAWHLKQLRDAGVPVLWRPLPRDERRLVLVGPKRGNDGYKKLYRMLYDRLVNFHPHLEQPDLDLRGKRVAPGVDLYDMYYPGADVVDVLATDVYRGTFPERVVIRSWPSPRATDRPGRGRQGAQIEVLTNEPKWTWFMTWGDPMGFGGTPADFPKMRAVYENDRTITWDKLPWVTDRNPRIRYPILK